MIYEEVEFRVRYAETDKMGYVYYGNYATYFEVARVELMRKIGITYKELENRGVILPVANFNIDYKRPAYYDDIITVTVKIMKKPGVRITFDYETKSLEGKVLNTAQTTLVFASAETGRAIKLPDDLEAIFDHYFSD